MEANSSSLSTDFVLGSNDSTLDKEEKYFINNHLAFKVKYRENEERGLMTVMVLLWVFIGSFAGYSSSRPYKMLKGTHWIKLTLKTTFMFPAKIFAIFLILNVLIWGEKSSSAVPFETMFALVFLWFGISAPLVFIGSYLGFKFPISEDPIRTKKIPRQTPVQIWHSLYLNTAFFILATAVLPFGVALLHLDIDMAKAVVPHFRFPIPSLCYTITIMPCYFQLSSEDTKIIVGGGEPT